MAKPMSLDGPEQALAEFCNNHVSWAPPLRGLPCGVEVLRFGVAANFLCFDIFVQALYIDQGIDVVLHILIMQADTHCSMQGTDSCSCS
jgi:hypothetical protein